MGHGSFEPCFILLHTKMVLFFWYEIFELLHIIDKCAVKGQNLTE